MKRLITYFVPAILLVFSSVQCSFSQDDVYYDPNKDKANDNTYQTYDTIESTPVDRTDGYSTGSSSADNSKDYSESYSEDGDTYITNNYYYDDDDSYLYTTRLRRYYTPNWGVNYYSYWFTPTFYYGWNSWNSGFAISYSPWYNDPWWGWNNCNYYSSWYDPYWGGNYCRNYGWGWNTGGFGGGYCGYGGYNNGYNNGYWNGYNNGYYDGWNSAYDYGSYDPYYNYNGPRRRSTIDGQTSNNRTLGYPEKTGVNPAVNTDKVGTTVREMDIPKEGIQRPINVTTPTQQNVPGTKVTGEKVVSPYNETGKVGIGKPQPSPSTVQPDKTTTPQIRQNTNVPAYTEQKPAEVKPAPKTEATQPVAPQQKNGWSAPPANISNIGERRENPNTYRAQPQQPVQQNNNSYNQNNYKPRTEPQPNNNQQRRQERVAQQNNYQPRSVEQPRPAQPRANPAPQQQNVQPRSNPQPQMQQRNFEQPRYIQPAPQQQRNINPGGAPGGGMKRQF